MKIAQEAKKNSLKALFTTAVWGDEYVDRFLKYSLRTQLSAGNLGAFDRDSLLLIITDAASIRRIKSSSLNEALSKLISVEFFDIKNIRSESANKYSLLTACQNYALARAIDFEAIFFGYGDALWADGSYQAAAKRLMQGYDAVFSFGYPVLDKAFKGAIDNRAVSIETDAVSIPPRTFAQMVYQYLHPMARANLWQSEWMTHCPSYIAWDVPSQGLLLRAFHMHPVAFRTLKDSPYFFTPFHSTLDEEFVARLSRTNARIYVSQSSDEIGVCSLAEESGLTYRMEPARPVNLTDLANFGETYAGLVHRHLFDHPLRLVVDEVIESNWTASEREASAIVSTVQRKLSTPDSVLALEQPTAFRARLQRQLNYRHWFESKDIAIGIDRVLAARDTWLTLSDSVDLKQAKLASVKNVVIRDKVAKDFAEAFQLNAGGVTSLRARARHLFWLGLRSTVNVLHALGVTRVVRTKVLPALPESIRTRVYQTVYRIGLIASPTPRSTLMHSVPRLGFFHWLSRLLRLHS